MKSKFKQRRSAAGLLQRRDFLGLCAAVAASLGLPETQIPGIAQALTSDTRPPLVYLNLAGCTGCTEALLRAQGPDFASLVFDVLNVVYLETLMAASGADSEALLAQAVADHAGSFICVVEGAIPTGAGGGYGLLGGRTFLEVANDVLPKAKYVVALGTCAAFGGLPAAGPNVTAAKSIKAATGISTINITGCPPHPLNLVSLLASYLLLGKMPPLRSDGRPSFCHGKTVHSRCTAPNGCLHGYKCNGPKAYNTCPVQLYNEESYCIQSGHMCIGCSESGFWDANAPFYTPEWSKAFAAFRSRARDQVTPENAQCTPCHESGYFQENLEIYGENRFQYNIHGIHGVDVSTGADCASCHLPPTGFGGSK